MSAIAITSKFPNTDSNDQMAVTVFALVGIVITKLPVFLALTGLCVYAKSSPEIATFGG
jgi:hypothetical protein